MDENKVMSDKKRGRPSKGNDFRISLRLSADEYSRICQYGQDNDIRDGSGNVNVSEAIRKMIDTYPVQSDSAHSTMQIEIPKELAEIVSEVASISGDSESDTIIRHIKQSVLHDVEALAAGLFVPKRKISKAKYHKLADKCERLTGLKKEEWLLSQEPIDTETTVSMYRAMGEKSMQTVGRILVPHYTEKLIDRHTL